MKRLKISTFAVIAIIMGIAASAFTSSKVINPSKGPLAFTWFQFMGSDPNNLSQVQNYLNYNYQTGLPCSGSSKICAVETNGTATVGQHPSSAFSTTLKNELSDVINNGGSYADISKKP